MKTLKILFTFIFLLGITCNAMYGQSFGKKLLKKNGDNSTAVLDTIAIVLDKNVTYYPSSMKDGKMNVSNSINFQNISSERIFINTMLYVINKAERGREHIVELDVEKKQLSAILDIPSDFYSDNSTYYQYANTFRTSGGELTFIASEMLVRYKNMMGDWKEFPFEDLDTNKKAKHKNYVNEHAALNSIYLNDLFLFVKTNQPEKVTNWNNIAEGKIVAGMNETECLLAVGKPMHIRKNGNQIKWMVNNDFVVIFENNIVIRVIR